jgi:hypothetical protein
MLLILLGLCAVAAAVSDVCAATRGKTTVFASGPEFHQPTGITANSSGHLFVANHAVLSGESHLLTITPDGEVSNYPPATTPVSFPHPLIDLCVIEADNGDEIYVASHFDISFVAADGENSPIVPLAINIDVEGLACGSRGDYAVYFTTRNFDVVGAGGTMVGSGAAVVRLDIGTREFKVWSSGMPINGPTGLALDCNNNLIIVNNGDDNIIQVPKEGGTAKIVASGDFFSHPFGIAIDTVCHNWFVTNLAGDNVMKVMEMVQGQDTSTNSDRSYNDRQVIFYASGSNFSSPTGITSNPLKHGEVFIANSQSSGGSDSVGNGAVLRVTPLDITSYPTPYPTPTADDDAATPPGDDDVSAKFTKRVYSVSLQDILLLSLAAVALVSAVMYVTYRRTQYVTSSPAPPSRPGRRSKGCCSTCCSILRWCFGGGGKYASVANERTPLLTPLQMLASPLLDGREYNPSDRSDDRELRKLLRRYEKADWLLQPEHATSRLKVGTRIGSGHAGSVHKGTFMGIPAAIKHVPLPVGRKRHGTVAKLLQEAAVLAELRHPNTVQFFGATFTRHDVKLITELCVTSLEEGLYQTVVLPVRFALEKRTGWGHAQEQLLLQPVGMDQEGEEMQERMNLLMTQALEADEGGPGDASKIGGPGDVPMAQGAANTHGALGKAIRGAVAKSGQAESMADITVEGRRFSYTLRQFYLDIDGHCYRRWFTQLVAAMMFLHSKEIIHR